MHARVETAQWRRADLLPFALPDCRGWPAQLQRCIGGRSALPGYLPPLRVTRADQPRWQRASVGLMDGGQPNIPIADTLPPGRRSLAPAANQSDPIALREGDKCPRVLRDSGLQLQSRAAAGGAFARPPSPVLRPWTPEAPTGYAVRPD